MSAKSRAKGNKQRATGAIDWKPWIALSLAAVALGLFLNTLGHELVFDDVTLILQNSQVTDLDWSGILFRGGYRPIRTLTYALNYVVGGTDPFGYHLVNVALHALNGVLAYFLLLFLLRSNFGAGLGALLFVVHPVQTAAVAYVSGRKDLLAALFLLAGFLLHHLYRQCSHDCSLSRRITLAIGAGTSFVLAILSKEVAIVFPVLLILIDSWRLWQNRAKEGEPPSAWSALFKTLKRSPAIYIAGMLVALAALYWAIFINQASRAKGYWGGTLETNIGTSFQLFVHYVKLAVVPHPLIADYTGKVLELSDGLLSPYTLVCVGVFLLWVGTAVWVFRQSALVTVGMLWFLITLAPVLQFVPFHELAADHFMYVPMIGVALLAGVGCTAISRAFGTRPVLAGVLTLAVVFAGMSFDRNRDWKDKKTLWEATLAAAPGSYRANANLGQLYFNEGRFEEGVRYTRKCFDLDPKRALPHANLGAMYYSAGQQLRKGGNLAEAKRYFDMASVELGIATTLDPKEPFAYGNWGSVYKDLALVLEAEGNRPAAEQARARAYDMFRKALSIPDPRATVKAIWLNLGNTYVDANDYVNAARCLRLYVKAFPGDPGGQYWLGYSLYQTKQYQEALPYLERAASANNDSDVWELVGRTFDALGNNQGAIGALVRAAELNPNSAEVRLNLGILYQRVGRLDLAVENLQKALELDTAGQFSATIDLLLRSMNVAPKG